MNITIIGYGHVGSILADRLAKVGHRIYVGIRDVTAKSTKNKHISFHSISSAVQKSNILIVSVPASAIPDVAKMLGDVSKKNYY